MESMESGVPFTMRDITLHRDIITTLRSPCIFETTSHDHGLHISGRPCQCVMAANRSCTSWVVKHIDDRSEVISGKIQVPFLLL